MSVLIEGYSVIINKAEALKNPAALEALSSVEATLHPMAICADNELLRVGFLYLEQAKTFIEAMEAKGLRFKTEQKGEEVAGEIMLATQFGEMEITCPWLQVSFTQYKDGTILPLASLKPTQVKGVALPKGWALADSILRPFHEQRLAHMQQDYTKLGDEGLFSVYERKSDQQKVRLVNLQVAAVD